MAWLTPVAARPLTIPTATAVRGSVAEILEAGIQRRHAKNTATQAHDSRDVLVIQTGRFDNQSHRITDDGNGRHGCDSKGP